MASEPKISIVIPCYNAEMFLADTLESVLAQSVTDWELIIVDDGSTDKTGFLAKGYPDQDERIRLIKQPNSGVAMARNAGMAYLSRSSEYVIFLDQDDIWEANALETLLDALDSHPDFAGAHGTARYINEHGDRVGPGELEALCAERKGIVEGRVEQWPRDVATTFDVLVVRNCIVTPGTLLIRRSILEEAGQFERALVPSDDWDMWLRLSRRNVISFVNKVVLNYRLHSRNILDKKRSRKRSEMALTRKWASLPELSSPQRKLIKIGYRNREISFAEETMDSAREKWDRGDKNEAFAEFRHAAGHYMRYLTGRM